MRQTAVGILLLALLTAGILCSAAVSLMPARAAASDTVQLRRTVPAMRLRDLDGVEHGLDEWQGQVLLVNFWASWCAPCQAEIPDLVRWQRQHGVHGLQIVGVGIDSPRPLANVQRSLGINYPILVVDPDQAGALLAQWGNTSRFVPYTVVIDRDGQIVHRQFGSLDSEIFDEFVTPLFSN